MPLVNRRARWLAMIVSARSRPQRSEAWLMFWRIVSSCTPWPGPVEAISSRLGSGAMFAASSSGSRRGGGSGWRVVRRLVEGEKEGRVDRAAGLRGALERAGGDVGDEDCEEAA